MKTITKAALLAALALGSVRAYAQTTGGASQSGTGNQTNPNPTPTPGAEQAAPGSTQEPMRPRQDAATQNGMGAATNGARSDAQVLSGVRSAILQPSAEAEGTVAPDVQNLRVTTRNGKILLRGTVRSQEEKAAIEARASEAANGMPIDNRLQVK